MSSLVILKIDFLYGSGKGVVKTKIMYNAYPSYHEVQKYLTILIKNGLFQYDSDNQKIWNTEKGLRFLLLCDQTGDLMEEEQQ
jgi:predicted transcriptional regulator